MADKQKFKELALIYLIAIILLIGIVAVVDLGKTGILSITGFAVSGNESSETINEETQSDEDIKVIDLSKRVEKEEKEKPEKAEPEKPEKVEEPEPNAPPVWKSDVEEFIINGKTIIDLNDYFEDKNNDTIEYTATPAEPDKIKAEIGNSLITITPAGNNFNSAITIAASDGDKTTAKEIALIVPERKITIDLEYKSGSVYDADDDGVETTAGVIDLTVEDTQFNWEVKEENLCTRWETYSVEEEESTIVCYGSSRCCQFAGLLAARPLWNEPFHSSYGTYGAGFNNIVSAQVLYVDYDLSVDDPYAELYNSEWADLAASYYTASTRFEDVCVDTCLLEGFNDTSYKLIFEIDGATIELDTLTYTLAETIDKVLVNLDIEDSSGITSGTYKLYKDNVEVAVFDNLIEPDYYDIEIVPKQKVINKLVIKRANITEPLTADIGIDDVVREQQIKDVEIKKQYAIDASEIKFETATLTATAQANALYKCRQWDYSTEVCYGTWEKVLDLTAGQEYEITITANDPGFVEGNINITIVPINITELTLIKDIPNMTIIKNNNYTIDLSQYFSNIDSSTIFTYNQMNNIAILFENNMATIVPDKGFIGIGFTFITAAKDDESAFSNVFSITATNATIDITPKLISEKKDFKFDEDVELDFEYLKKEELIEHGRWKEEFEAYEEDTEKTEAELELLKEKIENEEKLLTEAEKATKKQKKRFVKENESIETFVYDNEGNLKDIEIEIEELREGRFDIKLPKQRAFRAGRYTIKLELIKDNITYTQQQDFTWGVLAINVNKSIYLPNEDSFIGIGVLDDLGKIVCNADVALKITNPLNEKTILTTANNEIKISPECEVLGVTELPDYYTSYKVSGVGTYIMNLTAVTSNGVRSIEDNFTVASSVEFDVARKGPTRVYPAVPYTMNISIISNNNYNGIINEYVPAGFDISNVEIYEVSESEAALSAVENAEIIDKDLITKIEKEKSGFHSLANAPRQDLMSPQTKGIKQNLYKYLSSANLIENKETKENKKSLNQEETVQPEVLTNINRYLNDCIESENEENQAHSLNKEPVRLTGISHEFFLDSETAESHTVSDKEQSDYLNVLVDFFTLIPSAQAQQDNIRQNNIQSNIAITTLNGTKIISINANLKKGRKYVVSYEFDAPDISPEFYLLGPLDIGSFAEARNWQIANDVFMPANIARLIDLKNPLILLKLRGHAALNLKRSFSYDVIDFTGYEIKNNVVIVNITADGKDIRWITSLRNFNEVTD